MNQIGSFALSHQLTSICLDTYTFQAPLFYQRLGFIEVGRFVNFPVAGVDKGFFQKSCLIRIYGKSVFACFLCK
ncbi:Histone acetyltransferase [Marinomonas sp. MED121]|uniref:hypothetical protein n=1 Tax=Marinomonas sp. MED121 TaxID=314277 RepID=UPI000069014A|nr:hypothetical protein [Marinomonas sp. MED121]EAQ63306.1 Histone acetyltransferase [Marinomonas sp. MED121]